MGPLVMARVMVTFTDLYKTFSAERSPFIKVTLLVGQVL